MELDVDRRTLRGHREIVPVGFSGSTIEPLLLLKAHCDLSLPDAWLLNLAAE